MSVELLAIERVDAHARQMSHFGGDFACADHHRPRRRTHAEVTLALIEAATRGVVV